MKELNNFYTLLIRGNNLMEEELSHLSRIYAEYGYEQLYQKVKEKKILPFAARTFAACGFDTAFWEACLEQLTTIMLDASQVEITAVVASNNNIFERNPLRRIVSVREEPLDLEALQERPGIVGYIARTGDRLWDIAKENYTTIAGIQETNHLTEDVMKGGEKILIIKTVG